MTHTRRQRLFKIISLILPGLCLGLYLAYIQVMWLPELKGDPGPARQIAGPAASEFALFWTGSYMALHGEVAAVFHPVQFGEREQELTGVPAGHAWLYPPTYLLLVLPLALLPYHASLAVWLFFTLGAYLLVLRRICPHPLLLIWAAGFPALAANFLSGHNGALSGALLGGGLFLLNRFPIVAGVLLGLLLYKPQLAIIIPLALVLGRYWRTLGALAVTAAALALASGLVFGYAAWAGFIHNIPYAGLLVDVPSYWRKMPTVFAAARLAGLGATAAWMLQILAMLAALAGVAWVWSRRTSMACRAAILVLGLLLFTRYAFHYDYALLAIPLAWLWQEAQTTGWLPLEPALLLFAWIIPLPGIVLATWLGWPLGWPFLLTAALLFLLVLRRAHEEMEKTRGTLA